MQLLAVHQTLCYAKSYEGRDLNCNIGHTTPQMQSLEFYGKQFDLHHSSVTFLICMLVGSGGQLAGRLWVCLQGARFRYSSIVLA